MIVKICGITNLEDGLAALDAGADLLGFVFYPKSSRYVTASQAAEIVKGIAEWKKLGKSPGSSLQSPKLVGLFVNESVEVIRQTLLQTGLDYAQLHGDETPEMVEQLGSCAFRAIRPVSHVDAQTQAAMFYPKQRGTIEDAAPRMLIDAYHPAAYGGTGKKADWLAAAEVVRNYPSVLLAGGLTAENVAEAIQAVQPWGVDVSTGVEATPGKKDPAKVSAFVKAAKQR